jgi:ribosomal protein S18 acetylase RimI-like enzyme
MLPHVKEVLVRRAVDADADAVADVWLRSRLASMPAIPAPVHHDDEVRRWFADVVVPHREVWIAERPNDEVVGLLVLHEDWVDQLYVDPRWFGNRVGMRLLDLAKQRRPDGLQLWVFETNTAARRFYERHGFIAVEATDGDNEEGAPDVRYVWRPPQAAST